MSTETPAPPRDHQAHGADPGVNVRHRPVHGAQIVVLGDCSLLELHRRLLEAGLSSSVRDALRSVDGETPGDRRAVLSDAHGVTALNGHLAAVAADAAGDLRQLDLGRLERDQAHDLRALEQLLGQLGDGTAHGLPSTLDDLDDALPPLFATTDATPHVTVELGMSWAGRRPDQRAAALSWLTRLGMGARVDLVVSEAAARVMVDDHRDVLPTTALTSLRSRGRGSPAPLGGETAAATDDRTEAAEEALAALDEEGRPMGLLRALGRQPAHAADYETLARSTATDRARLHEPARVLVERGLAETFDATDGRRMVSLSPAGLDALRRLSRSSGPSGPSGGAAVERTGGELSAVSDHPQISPAMPCGPGQGREGPSPSAAPPDGPDGPEEGDDWHQGTVWPRLAGRERSAPVHALGERGDVVLANVVDDDDLSDDLGRPLSEVDPRRPVVSFDDTADEAILSFDRYENPMQSWVSLALAATSEELWGEGELEERIGDSLRGLDIRDRGLLWNAVEAGWLPRRDDGGQPVDDGEAVHEQLRGARDDLRDDLRELDLRSRHSDEPDHEIAANRRQVAAFAAGLVTTVVDLLDLAGVDVLLELRVAGCSQHFGEHNPGRRDDLLEHVSRLSMLNSRAGAWSVWRQLFEHREGRRSDGWTPGAGAPETASLNCGIVITGGSVETLEGDLRDELGERSTHPDSPGFGVDVGLRVGAEPARLASTARRSLLAKGIRPTPTVLSVLSAYASDPWAVASGVRWGLGSDGREAHLDEARTVLASLDDHRLISTELKGSDVPGRAPRRGLAALLEAEGPLSQAELARRAGISTQTWRDWRDRLDALGLVRETAEGWRVTLPRRSERYDPPELARPPWWLAAEAGEEQPLGDGLESRRAVDVLDWLMWDRLELGRDELPPPARSVLEQLATGEQPDRSLVDEALRSLGAPPELVRAGCRGDGPPPTSTVRVGPRKQTRLSDHPQISPIGG